MSKDNNFDETLFLKTAMDMAEQQGWGHFEANDVADMADMDPQSLPPELRTKQDILNLFENHITQEVKLAAFDLFEGDETIREKLFELLMERFVLMDPYKGGLKAVFKGLPKTPSVLVKSARPFRDMAKEFLNIAGADLHCPMREFKIAGFSLIYLKTVRVWLGDDSQDLGKTMAELDKNLNFAEQVAGSFLARGPLRKAS